MKLGFQDVAPVARQIIDKGRDWKRWVLCDRDPVTNWVDGRVALLAMRPIRCCNISRTTPGWRWRMPWPITFHAQPDALEAALQAYQSLRRLRTARVQLQSREIGQHVYHPAAARMPNCETR